MIIAVPYESGQIFQHFGRTPQWKCYTVQNHTVTASEIRSSNTAGHGALVDLLQSWHVDAVVCGGIGPGAQERLKQAGIQVYAGVSGKADDAVAQLLNKTLQYTSNQTCDHHHEDHMDHETGSCNHCDGTHLDAHHCKQS